MYKFLPPIDFMKDNILVYKKTPKHQSKNDSYDPYINQEGELGLWDDDLRFCHDEFKVLATPHTKAYYAIASFLHDTPKDAETILEKIVSILQEKYPNLKTIDIPKKHKPFYAIYHDDRCIREDMLTDGKYIDESGIIHEVAYIGYMDREEWYGKITEENDGLLERFLHEKDISLKDFLLEDKYVIVSNDETDMLQKLEATRLMRSEDYQKYDNTNF